MISGGAHSYELPNGTGVVADTFTTHHTGSFERIYFGETFHQPPVVLTAVSTCNGIDAVGLRLRNISTTDFEFCMPAQELDSQGNTPEDIAFSVEFPLSFSFELSL